MAAGVQNQQLANETIFNGAFIPRNGDGNTVGRLDLQETASGVSGSDVINLQRNINMLASMLGVSTNQVYNAVITWASTVVGSGSSDAKAKIEALVLKFLGSGGHDHSAVDGMGSAVSALDLININKYRADYQTFDVTALTGLSVDVSTEMGGKDPNGSTVTTGVLTSPPYNRVWVRNTATEDFIEDGSGHRVYGKLTEAATVWTIEWFVNIAGVETAFDMDDAGNPDATIYFLEVFDLSSMPTIPSNPAQFGTLDVTGDVVDAASGRRGVVSTGTQTFSGDKTFEDDISANNLSGTNTGDASIGPVGNNPNANGGTFTGQVLNLQPANGTNPGVVSILAQAFAGLKTFVDGIFIQKRLQLEIATDNTTTGSLATFAMPDKAAVRFTHAGLVSIQEISGGAAGYFAVLINDVGTDVLVKNLTGTAGNQINTGSGADFNFKSGSALILYRNGSTNVWHIVGGGGGAGLSPQAIGSTPNANGMTYNSGTGALNLEPANASFGGVMTTGTQTLAGAKTWTGNQILQAILRGDFANDAATTGAGATLPAPSKLLVRLTNASLTSITNGSGLTNEQVFFIMNTLTTPITLTHNSGAAGFYCPGNADFVLEANQTVMILFSSADNRMLVIAGGGGRAETVAVQTVTAGSTVNSSQRDRQIRHVKGASGGVAASTTPFGSGGWPDGTEIELIGESDSDYLDITYNDNNYGVVGAFSTKRLTNYSGMRFIWKNSALRWIGYPSN